MKKLFTIMFFVYVFVSFDFIYAKTKITFYHAMTHYKYETLKKLIYKFEKEYPDIEVIEKQIKSPSPYGNNYNELLKELLISVQKNDPPTLAQVYENWTTQFIEVKAIYPVYKFLQNDNSYSQELENDLIIPFKKSNSYNGKLYTVPFNKSIYVLFYNKDLFKQNNIKNPPKTWKELISDAKKITKGDIIGFAFKPNIDTFHIIYQAFGKDLFNGSLAVYNNIYGQKTLKMLYDIVYKYKCGKATYKYASLFYNGKVGMIIKTSSNYPYLNKGNFNLGISVIPKIYESPKFFAGTNIAVFNKSTEKQKQAAWKFLKFLLRPENTAFWAINTGYLPVRYSAINLKMYQDYLKKNPEMIVAINSIGEANYEPTFWSWQAIRHIISEVMQDSIEFKRYNIKTALDLAVEKSNRLLQSNQFIDRN